MSRPKYLLINAAIGALSDSRATDRIPPTVRGPDGRILPTLGTNQIAGFIEHRPLKHQEKKMTRVSFMCTLMLCLLLFVIRIRP